MGRLGDSYRVSTINNKKKKSLPLYALSIRHERITDVLDQKNYVEELNRHLR
jgi:hypothetical protein